MTTAEENENNANDNAADAAGENTADAAAEQQAAQEAQLRKFEKFFRLLDSPVDGEAESAFRQARKALPKIGLTFGDILDMLDNTGGADQEKLMALIEEYKQANDQLKAAEDIIISENTRLNFLLRNLRDADVQVKDLDADSFKKNLISTIEKVSAVNKEMSSITLPENPEELENIYKLRIAEALMPHKGHVTKGVFDRLMVWGLRQFGRDISPEGILRMQDLVFSQEKLIKEQSELLNDIKDVQRRGLEISEKLDLVVSASAPQSVYNEALRQLKEAQLMLGDAQDLKSLQAANAELESKVVTLADQKTSIERQAIRLQEELEEARLYHAPHDDSAEEAAKAAPKGKAKASAKDNAASTPPQPKIMNPEKMAGTTEYKNLEEQLNIQDRHMRQLQAQLGNHNIQKLFSAEETQLVDKLELFLPLLSNASAKLDQATQAIMLPPPKKTGINAFFAALAKPFKGKNADQEKLDKAVEDIKSVTETVQRAEELVGKLSGIFNEQAKKCESDVIERIQNYQQDALSTQKRLYDEASRKFGSSLSEAAEKQVAYFKQAEKDHQDSIDRLEKQIKETTQHMTAMQKSAQEYETQLDKELQTRAAAAGTENMTAEQTVEIRTEVANRMIFEAVRVNDLDKVRLLLKKGADIDAVNGSGETLLMRAAFHERAEMAALLVSSNINLFIKNAQGYTIFEYIEKRSWDKYSVKKEISDTIVNAMPDATQKHEAATPDADSQRNVANQVLLKAASDRDKDFFALALQKGADINAFNSRGYTALMIASEHEGSDMIDTVLAAKPDIFLKNANDKDVFDIMKNRSWNRSSAREVMMNSIMSALPDAEAAKPAPLAADVAAEQQQRIANNLFLMGFEGTNTGFMDSALTKGADINCVNSSGNTPLMAAIVRENADLVTYVLSKNPDLFLTNKEEKTVFDMLKKSWNSTSAKQRIMEALLDVLPAKVQPKNKKRATRGGPA